MVIEVRRLKKIKRFKGLTSKKKYKTIKFQADIGSKISVVRLISTSKKKTLNYKLLV